MTNEEFQKLVLEKLGSLEQNQKSLEQNQGEMRQAIARIENDQGTKIAALFDGYTLCGDQIEKLQEHLDVRLDAMQTDLSYVVSKVAQHERNLIKLNNKKVK